MYVKAAFLFISQCKEGCSFGCVRGQAGNVRWLGVRLQGVGTTMANWKACGDRVHVY